MRTVQVKPLLPCILLINSLPPLLSFRVHTRNKVEIGDASISGISGSYNLYSVRQTVAILASTPHIHEVIDLFYSNSPLIIIDYLRETNKLTDNQQIVVVHNDLGHTWNR